MELKDFVACIAQEMNLQLEQVQNTLDLLNGGATIPFISRYRKEATGSLDEVQIEQIKNMYARLMELEKRRAAIVDSVREQGKLTPELEAQFMAAATMLAKVFGCSVDELLASDKDGLPGRERHDGST